MLAHWLAGRMERKGSFFAPQLFPRCPLEGNCLIRASLSSPEQMSSWDLLLILVAGCEIPQPSVQRENTAPRSLAERWCRGCPARCHNPRLFCGGRRGLFYGVKRSGVCSGEARAAEPRRGLRSGRGLRNFAVACHQPVQTQRLTAVVRCASFARSRPKPPAQLAAGTSVPEGGQQAHLWLAQPRFPCGH